MIVVWFNDYNEDVLDEMTIPNTILNSSSSDDDKIKPETRFFSGDWTSLEQEFLCREIISEEQKTNRIRSFMPIQE